MSTDSITAAANADTPQNVIVPPGIAGLIIWAVGRVGPSVVIALGMAIAFGWALREVYEDNAALIKQMMVDNEARTVMDTQHVEVLRSMQTVLERIAGSTGISASNSTKAIDK
jgi:hypothetical protein